MSAYCPAGEWRHRDIMNENNSAEKELEDYFNVEE